MRVINISQFEDSVVIHFETEGQRINAYTLASTLVSIGLLGKFEISPKQNAGLFLLGELHHKLCAEQLSALRHVQ